VTCLGGRTTEVRKWPFGWPQGHNSCTVLIGGQVIHLGVKPSGAETGGRWNVDRTELTGHLLVEAPPLIV